MKSPQARTSTPTHLNFRLVEGDNTPDKLAYLTERWGIGQSNAIRHAITLCYNAEMAKSARAEGGG